MRRAATTSPSQLEERPRLDRDRILDAAEAIVAVDGVGALTMRRMGQELGADPTAVYRHFRNKDELLTDLAERLFGTVAEVDPSLGWRERLKAEMQHALGRYRCHPDLAALLAVQPDSAPNLQVVAEGALGLLAEAGLSPRDAARMYKVIENHVVGTGLFYALVEDRIDPQLADAAAMRRHYALLPADRFPHAVAAAPYLFPSHDEAFDLATDLILDAIERMAQASTTSTDEGPSA
jgi:AcrR family transcriptional regulator